MDDLPNDPTADPDAHLVRLVQEGDTSAFDALVLKYQRRLQRLVGRFVRDTDRVDDLVQESFIRAYRALPRFRGDSAFYTWLYRIAVNTAKKALMEDRRSPVWSASDRPIGSGESDGEQETLPPGGEPRDEATPEAILASRQVAQAVQAAVDDLSEELRQAIVLREIEGLSYDEIAQLMGCPIGTVRSRIFRAREAIAQRLRPLLDRSEGRRW